MALQQGAPCLVLARTQPTCSLPIWCGDGLVALQLETCVLGDAEGLSKGITITPNGVCCTGCD